MKLKDAIEYFKNRKKEKVETSLEELFPNCPELTITDNELLVTLGQWMGKLPDSVKIGGNGMFFITHLDANELLAKNKISDTELKVIEKRFANLLRMAGFGKGNICALDNFDRKNLTFDCYFYGTGDEAKMRISFGSWIDSGPELIIEYDQIKTIYDYIRAYEDEPDRLQVQSVTKEVDGNGKKFHRYVSRYTYYGYVYDKDNKLSVKIDYPEAVKEDGKNSFVDIEKMEEVLSSVTFPTEIEDLCKKVASALLVDSKELGNLEITVRKMKDQEELNVTDQAHFYEGQFRSLTKTKNGKTITVDQFDAWSYTTPTYKVNQTADNQLNCSYTNMPLTELVTMSTPQELVESLTPEVEDVKKLAKNLL